MTIYIYIYIYIYIHIYKTYIYPYKTNTNIYIYIYIYIHLYLYICIYIYFIYVLCVLAKRVECSPMVQETVVLIPGQVIPKTLKKVLDTSLLNTQLYKVCIKGKVEQSRERSCSLLLHLSVVAIEKGAFWSPTLLTYNSLNIPFLEDYAC